MSVIETKVDGGKATIVYENADVEHLPVGVFVDGQLQKEISAVPKLENGIGAIDEVFTEYNNNIASFVLSGTTIQNGIPTPDTPISIQNANDNGMSVIVQGANLIDTQGEIFKKSGAWTFAENRISASYIIGNNIYFYYEKEYEAGTYTISFERTEGLNVLFLSTVQFAGSTQNDYYGGYYRVITDKRTITFGQSFRMGFAFTTTTLATASIWNVMFSKQDIPYEPYFRYASQIPTSLDYLYTYIYMSEYDKLTVEHKSKKVKYLQGCLIYEFNGYEATDVLNGSNGRFTFAYDRLSSYTDVTVVENVGLCSHFKKVNSYSELTANTFCVSFDYDKPRVFFQMADTTMTTLAFNEFLQEQKANGTPVTILLQRTDIKEYDISMTDIGLALLDLSFKRKLANTFEILSNANAPLVPINLSYFIWGGRNENNNNT